MKIDMLEEIFILQEKFGKKFNDFNKIKKSKYTRQKKTIEFIDHTIEELIELRREMPIRKDWSKKHKSNANWQRALEEYVDALHFFITIALVNGWTAKEVYDAYNNKNALNHNRIKEGY